jgi:hypothetical protein
MVSGLLSANTVAHFAAAAATSSFGSAKAAGEPSATLNVSARAANQWCMRMFVLPDIGVFESAYR